MTTIDIEQAFGRITSTSRAWAIAEVSRTLGTAGDLDQLPERIDGYRNDVAQLRSGLVAAGAISDGESDRLASTIQAWTDAGAVIGTVAARPNHTTADLNTAREAANQAEARTEQLIADLQHPHR